MSLEEKVDKISRMIASFSTNEQLLILERVQHTVVEQSNGEVIAAKVNGGSKSELIACMAMQDLTWCGKANNGPDAYDSTGCGVELKTINYRQKTQCNANWKFPARPEGMDDRAYRELVVQDYATNPKYSGGLRMVAMTHTKSRVHHWYIIPSNMLGAIVEGHLRKNPRATLFNPGGKPCRKCRLLHRMQQIQIAAEQGKVMVGKIDSICRPLPESQIASGATLPEIL